MGTVWDAVGILQRRTPFLYALEGVYMQGLRKAIPNKIPAGENEQVVNSGTVLEFSTVPSAYFPLLISSSISMVGMIGKGSFKNFPILIT